MNPKVLRAADRAMAKALDLQPHVRVWRIAGEHSWRVVSPTTGEVYHVDLAGYQSDHDRPFWVAFRCTCPAEEAGYEVCYHKALVRLSIRDDKEATTLD